MPQVNPLWLLKYLPNMPASHIAIINDFRGPSNSITDREASFNASIDCAARIIATGRADAMLVGATGTRLHPVRTLQTLSQEEVAPASLTPSEASRPFDRDRNGMVLGEGAGAIILEEEQLALRRGATIHGRVIAAAVACSRGRNRLADRRQALGNAMRRTLLMGQVAPKEIGHVHAHGLGTRSCDTEEAAAIIDAFEEHGRDVPVVALKSYTGNLGAGSGAVEFIASILALRDGRLFSTLNYANPDSRCPLSVNTGIDTPSGDSFLNLSVSPQGQAAVVLTTRE
jgi:3-oxoacyl-[acyl-carrier-protein] synthase II